MSKRQINNKYTKKLIIHIGMHKTGSTSIQETCSKNFEYENYAYLDLRTMNHNYQIFSLFSENPENYYLNKNLDSLQIKYLNEKNVNMIRERLENIKQENVIISGEDIINLSSSALGVCRSPKVESL